MQDKVCRDCSNDKSIARKRDFVKEIYALSFSLVEWTKAPQDKREELERKRRIKRADGINHPAVQKKSSGMMVIPEAETGQARASE